MELLRSDESQGPSKLAFYIYRATAAEPSSPSPIVSSLNVLYIITEFYHLWYNSVYIMLVHSVWITG